ncbi:hypothetical protein JXB11_03505 [Candidatus Woesearchaeota archaeon]|nr:hypothetical protein [Candidatus Woesearchaeota archaeon]
MDTVDNTPASPVSFEFQLELILLLILGMLTGAQIIFKDFFIALIEPVFSKIALAIAASVAAILPGIIYEGGEWYRRLASGAQFTTREKAFVIFLIEIGLSIIAAVGAQRLIVYLFPHFIKYVWILIAEWFLILYIWFTRLRRYSFPWFYVLATNIILAGFAYVTYAYA